jgi:S1-C subfamily serine protease
VVVQPVRVPGDRGRREAFGLLVSEVEPESPAAAASLMVGDILLGTEVKKFGSVGDLARALDGAGLRLLRLEFLRGDYTRVRRVTVQLDAAQTHRSVAAA